MTTAIAAASTLMSSSTEPTPNGVCSRDLSKAFDDIEVVKSLDLTIERGTIVGLIGPSGSGKTTTVRLLAGLLEPTSGWATVDGTRSTQLTTAERARIGYLPQSPALFPELSLSENLSFHASMYGLPFRRRARLDEMLEWVELGEHRTKRVEATSGGMQKRLALAAAFVHDPDVLFLDEPTAGIDPILRDSLWGRFRGAADEGKALLVTTQYVAEAGECDAVGLLSDGELVLFDTPRGLRRAAFDGEPVDIEVDRPATDHELAVLASDSDVRAAERIGPQTIRAVVGWVDDPIDVARRATRSAGLDVVGLSEHVVAYDEAFVRVIERHRGDGHQVHADETDAAIDGVHPAHPRVERGPTAEALPPPDPGAVRAPPARREVNDVGTTR